ncbi:MAG: M23 family metallopeptidase [Ignavibacteriales bacterium]|nr:M23 family metallopeptidase [Ignavibacteriales bacterium]
MQRWNGSMSHYGFFSYAVDFTMQPGTIVTASHQGVVEWIERGYSNSDAVPGHENVIIVRHEDSTFTRYVHLSPNSERVSLSEAVNTGDTLTLSGQSGTPIAHLHFDVTKGCNDRNCQTIPFIFLNTIAHPRGLDAGTICPAR